MARKIHNLCDHGRTEDAPFCLIQSTSRRNTAMFWTLAMQWIVTEGFQFVEWPSFLTEDDRKKILRSVSKEGRPWRTEIDPNEEVTATITICQGSTELDVPGGSLHHMPATVKRHTVKCVEGKCIVRTLLVIEGTPEEAKAICYLADANVFVRIGETQEEMFEQDGAVVAESEENGTRTSADPDVDIMLHVLGSHVGPISIEQAKLAFADEIGVGLEDLPDDQWTRMLLRGAVHWETNAGDIWLKDPNARGSVVLDVEEQPASPYDTAEDAAILRRILGGMTAGQRGNTANATRAEHSFWGRLNAKGPVSDVRWAQMVDYGAEREWWAHRPDPADKKTTLFTLLRASDGNEDSSPALVLEQPKKRSRKKKTEDQPEAG